MAAAEEAEARESTLFRKRDVEAECVPYIPFIESFGMGDVDGRTFVNGLQKLLEDDKPPGEKPVPGPGITLEAFVKTPAYKAWDSVSRPWKCRTVVRIANILVYCAMYGHENILLAKIESKGLEKPLIIYYFPFIETPGKYCEIPWRLPGEDYFSAMLSKISSYGSLGLVMTLLQNLQDTYYGFVLSIDKCQKLSIFEKEDEILAIHKFLVQRFEGGRQLYSASDFMRVIFDVAIDQSKFDLIFRLLRDGRWSRDDYIYLRGNYSWIMRVCGRRLIEPINRQVTAIIELCDAKLGIGPGELAPEPPYNEYASPNSDFLPKSKWFKPGMYDGCVYDIERQRELAAIEKNEKNRMKRKPGEYSFGREGKEDDPHLVRIPESCKIRLNSADKFLGPFANPADEGTKLSSILFHKQDYENSAVFFIDSIDTCTAIVISQEDIKYMFMRENMMNHEDYGMLVKLPGASSFIKGVSQVFIRLNDLRHYTYAYVLNPYKYTIIAHFGEEHLDVLFDIRPIDPRTLTLFDDSSAMHGHK